VRVGVASSAPQARKVLRIQFDIGSRAVPPLSPVFLKSWSRLLPGGTDNIFAFGVDTVNLKVYSGDRKMLP